MGNILLETERLTIRAFEKEDLSVIHRILDQTFGDGSNIDNEAARQERSSWVQWQALNHEWFPKMYQPPYGDRAVVLKATDTLIGSVGYVPCLGPFDQLPALRDTDQSCGYSTPEFDLFWVIDPGYQNQGYATEAAQAMIDFTFEHLHIRRVVATTEYDNKASQEVMRKLGMRLECNPRPDPEWLQVVGIKENTNPVACEIN